MSGLILDAARVIDLLQAVADDLKTHIEELRELDARLGDGDLGVTIDLAGRAIVDYLATTGETDVGKLLVQCGLNINKVSPSTFGTILASAFMGGGKAVAGKIQLDMPDLVLVGEAVIENIKKRGKAEAGDKTVLDTLIPAVEAFRREVESRTDISTAVTAAVTAAEEGMKATTKMKAKFGRAQWFQERSIGIQDGGATAIYYMIKSFAGKMSV
jgi:dihydroxyacetone kinase-like protein